ncbi:hypothetical protein Nepgr_009848 [Nepenthes gracilis]|uniref:Uncharacterized protein n=1 Tax=Nepenthes gracilis TaxID=150966 RepID=A0AAD3XKI7_NEPGR|nr:hypothetical protein Nepgr_009848 [Nepenthes gracilis]
MKTRTCGYGLFGFIDKVCRSIMVFAGLTMDLDWFGIVVAKKKTECDRLIMQWLTIALQHGPLHKLMRHWNDHCEGRIIPEDGFEIIRPIRP